MYSLVRKGEKENKQVVIRLNGFSDIPFHKEIPELYTNPDFKDVVFSDYTKDQDKFDDYMAGKLPKNQYFVFSAHEENWDYPG